MPVLRNYDYSPSNFSVISRSGCRVSRNSGGICCGNNTEYIRPAISASISRKSNKGNRRRVDLPISGIAVGGATSSTAKDFTFSSLMPSISRLDMLRL